MAIIDSVSIGNETRDIYDKTASHIPVGATVTPTDSIPTWLACAGLQQSYTTLSDVLADEAVLSALMSSPNAVDYLVRSTTWATTICANETAMSYIGINDYCADILRYNSTWKTAINNSTYFEEVLNVKVPKMASNTTPYGEAFAGAQSQGLTDYQAYWVFDGIIKNWTGKYGYRSELYPDYIAYDFGVPVSISKAWFVPRYDVARDQVPKNTTLQYSTDKTTWVDASETVTLTTGKTTREEVDIPITVQATARYWRAYFTGGSIAGSNIVCVDALQFYGRGELFKVDTKADITAIAPEEAVATASRAYAVGENFYKNGKFCTAITAIARGATFTLGTNYIEGTISDTLNNRKVLLYENQTTVSNTNTCTFNATLSSDMTKFKFIFVEIADLFQNTYKFSEYFVISMDDFFTTNCVTRKRILLSTFQDYAQVTYQSTTQVKIDIATGSNVSTTVYAKIYGIGLK